MAKYSIPTETTLRPKVVRIAILVAMPSMSDIASGPISLQNRSMRRICELRTVYGKMVSASIFAHTLIEAVGRRQYSWRTLKSKVVGARTGNHNDLEDKDQPDASPYVREISPNPAPRPRCS